MASYDYALIGAGLFNIVLANKIAVSGKKVLVIERRSHIGGNCYDKIDKKTNILVHAYGPHIFHFNNYNILKYLEKYSLFVPYHHRVLSLYKNKLYQMPITIETINKFYGTLLRPNEVSSFLSKTKKSTECNEYINMEDKCISLIGRELYEAFFKYYTQKQWGKKPKDLPPDIINRIPVRYNYRSSYYNKKYSYLPNNGFTYLFHNMLDHPNIRVVLNTEYKSIKNDIKNIKIIYTGTIDSFFDYQYGKLEYRSLNFVKEYIDVQDWQGISVINYPEPQYKWTRICEPRHFYYDKWDTYSQNATVIFKEIPVNNENDPYYPINDSRNMIIFNQYAKLASYRDDIIFGGRLGEYKYYDMENTIESALKLYMKLEG